MRLGREDDEARGVVVLVLDIRPADLEPVDLGGKPGGDRRPVAVAALREFARRARRVGGDDGRSPSSAITLRHWPSAWTWLCTVSSSSSRDAGHPEQLMMDAQEVLADDIEMRCRHQMVDVGDAPGHRVVDRDHREMRRPGRHGRKGVLERAARQRFVIGKRLAQAMCELAPGSP